MPTCTLVGKSFVRLSDWREWTNLVVLFIIGRMRPEVALQEQIQRYRRMTGEQRLAIALELHELSCNIARQGIRAQHPQANDAEVERFLHRRLELARR